MKKYILILLASMVIFTACEDTEAPYLSPIDEISNGVKRGAWVRMNITNLVIDFENLSGSVFTADLEDEADQVASYDISVSWVRGNVVSDTVPLKSITAFPTELQISAQEIADALDSALTDFSAGDRVDFVATITSKDGDVTRVWPPSESNISTDLLNPGQLQALSYSAFVACPINADFSGAYQSEQVAGPADPFFGAATRFATEEVTMTAPNLITRTWNVTYIGFTANPFTVLMLCGNVSVPKTNTGIGCGGPGLNWVSDVPDGNYNPDDDSVFDINIIENVDGGCGLPANPGTVLRMTKL